MVLLLAVSSAAVLVGGGFALLRISGRPARA